MRSAPILRKLSAGMKVNGKNSKTVTVATLGCKVNQCESASFQSCFEEQGLTLHPFDAGADIYVINTCAVTAKAAAQSRQLIRRAQRANPAAKIVVTGCYAQVEPEKIREFEGAPITLVGNANKHQLVEAALADGLPPEPVRPWEPRPFFNDIRGESRLTRLPGTRFPGRTRAFLKVQDGCNNFCSYCIVPHARGTSRSLTLEAALEQTLLYRKHGHGEIVITGIHVGHYGLDLKPPVTLIDLLQTLMAAAPQTRFRLSSLEPTEISRTLLELMAGTDNFMPHLHIPLQSGSDETLRRMRRRYTGAQFIDKVLLARELLPAAAIGVDVLVGFPGETEKDFQQTYDLAAGLPITYLHVFPYSRRPGTPAAAMKPQVPNETKDERVALLRKLDHKKRNAFYKSRLGRVHPVLVEAATAADGLARGLSDNYIPIRFRPAADDSRRVVPVKLERLQDRFVIGRVA